MRRHQVGLSAGVELVTFVVSITFLLDVVVIVIDLKTPLPHSYYPFIFSCLRILFHSISFLV